MSASATAAALVAVVMLIAATGWMLHRRPARYPPVLLTVHKLAGVASVVLAGRWLLHVELGPWSASWILGVSSLLTVVLLATGGLLAARSDRPSALVLGHGTLGISAALALTGVAAAVLVGAVSS